MPISLKLIGDQIRGEDEKSSSIYKLSGVDIPSIVGAKPLEIKLTPSPPLKKVGWAFQSLDKSL